MTSRSLDILTDACGDLPVVIRKMFGGHGFFAPNGGMFAGIVTDDEVILKLVDGPARDELIAEGGHPWVYSGQDKPMTMSSWIVVPERFYDDPEAFMTWAARAFELAPPKKAKPVKKAVKAPPKKALLPVKTKAATKVSAPKKKQTKAKKPSRSQRLK
ncbi:MAG: TfoX/Sxy family protein [Myxococcales bacterium]|nr:TfoX/Sxy family protein [Myxococcales bacterium]